MLRGVVGALLVTLTAAGGYAVSSHKTVTLTVAGDPMTVPTKKATVIDVVEENGFDVGERDDLYPAAETAVHQSDNIVLRRSRPLDLSLDGNDSKQVWTTASTVDEALAQLKLTDTAPAAASRVSRVPLAGMALPVVSAKTVQIDDGGAVSTVHLAAPNVAGLLQAAGVPLEQHDAVVPPASSPVIEGMQIQVSPTPPAAPCTSSRSPGRRPATSSSSSAMCSGGASASGGAGTHARRRGGRPAGGRGPRRPGVPGRHFRDREGQRSGDR